MEMDFATKFETNSVDDLSKLTEEKKDAIIAHYGKDIGEADKKKLRTHLATIEKSADKEVRRMSC